MSQPLDAPLRAIGTVRNARPGTEDDFWGGVISEVVLADDLPAGALAGLADFSHVHVLYLLHGVEGEPHLDARHPRGRDDLPALGIFAQRAKRRPNRIGLACCRVRAVRGRVLEVEDLDAIDGTPVLDLKPVMEAFGPRGPVREPAWTAEIMADYWRPAGDRPRPD